MHAAELRAALPLGAVQGKVLLGSQVQFARKLDADDGFERVVRGHHQCATLARAVVDEGEVLAAQCRPDPGHHVAEQARRGRFVVDALIAVTGDVEFCQFDALARVGAVQPIEAPVQVPAEFVGHVLSHQRQGLPQAPASHRSHQPAYP